MTHKTDTIELNDRELEALKKIVRYTVTVNVGAGVKGQLNLSGDTDIKTLKEKSVELSEENNKRGAIIYAVGLVGEMEVPVMVATYIPKAIKKWKLADTFGV